VSNELPRIGTKRNCKNCGLIIVFERYYCDGKAGPNPVVWFHLPGHFICWVPGIDDKRRAAQRQAEPAPDRGELVDVRSIRRHLEPVHGRIRVPELRLTAAQREVLDVVRAPRRSRNPLGGSLRHLPRVPVVEVETVGESTPYLEGWVA
jgi:hypothetical protein